eukprot:TRINITY_DN3599_c0_g1_i9.p1 TRINITY_DN3599_c0_g1~~TRINITY_DN3599_c0_g1_i9.p1  ORF type:complete len:224 (-),score=24.76 TRINITY_DN3599_c0_g1_i9:595-1266(-)
MVQVNRYQQMAAGRNLPTFSAERLTYDKAYPPPRDSTFINEVSNYGYDAYADGGRRYTDSILSYQKAPKCEGVATFVESVQEDSEVYANGRSCSVRKHKPGQLGCAVIILPSRAIREVVMRFVEFNSKSHGTAPIELCQMNMTIRRHIDTRTQEDLPTDLYVFWGHKPEKAFPLPPQALADDFDRLIECAMAEMNTKERPPHPEDIPACRFTVNVCTNHLMSF